MILPVKHRYFHQHHIHNFRTHFLFHLSNAISTHVIVIDISFWSSWRRTRDIFCVTSHVISWRLRLFHSSVLVAGQRACTRFTTRLSSFALEVLQDLRESKLLVRIERILESGILMTRNGCLREAPLSCSTLSCSRAHGKDICEIKARAKRKRRTILERISRKVLKIKFPGFGIGTAPNLKREPRVFEAGFLLDLAGAAQRQRLAPRARKKRERSGVAVSSPSRGGSPTRNADFRGLVLGWIETKFCK